MRNTFLWRTAAFSLILCLCLPLLPACGGGTQTFSATYFDETFDTVLTITIGAKSAAEAGEHCAAIKRMVSRLHRLFDAYKTYPNLSNIATLNAAEPGTPVSLSADVLSLLSLGQEVYEQTDGAVHIGIGALTSLWKVAIEEKTPPNPASLAEALSAVQPPNGMVVDEAKGTVTLTTSGLQVDVGAIAKGYVLDKVRLYAESAGIQSLLCNLGGEILAVGSAPNGEAWEISIASPDGGTLETIRVRDAAVATGGDYERGFTIDGRRYHHIVDPATGYPAAENRAATVIMPLDAARLSDAYSTALMLLPAAQGEALLDDVPEAASLRVAADGTVHRSAGWSDFVS